MPYFVVYSGNGQTGGSVPVDSTAYAAGDTVTVLDPGNLHRDGATFNVWNTATDESGTGYGPGQTFTIGPATGNVILWAQWYTTAGLKKDMQTGKEGRTPHYAFSYSVLRQKDLLNPTGLEPDRTNQLIEACEDDYALMARWFGGISLPWPAPTTVDVSYSGPDFAGSAWGKTKLHPADNGVDILRSLLVAEVTEFFMQSQNKGWYSPDGVSEQSCGEGLSWFLTQQFQVMNGLAIQGGNANLWLNSSLPPSDPSSSQLGGALTTLLAPIDNAVTSFAVAKAQTIPFPNTYIIQIDNEQMLVTAVNTATNTLTVIREYYGTIAAGHNAAAAVHYNYGPRSDYVNTTLEYDRSNSPASGCSLLFIYYLFTQLRFSINDIIDKAPGVTNAATCLAGVYKNLTEDASDPFPFFKQLLDNAYPPNVPASNRAPNPDDPWPLGSLSFVGGKNYWGHDEASDLVNNPLYRGLYKKAFSLMLEGFNRQVAGSTKPSTPVVAFTGVTTPSDPAGNPPGIEYESDNPYTPQRIRYPYDVHFDQSALPAFPSPPSGVTPAAVTTSIKLLGKLVPASSEFFFIAGANPYFTNVLPNPDPKKENASWLSEDLRVFTATAGPNQHPVPGGPVFSDDSFTGAYTYIAALIGHLNQKYGDPSQTDPFDPSQNVIPGQLDALTGASSVTPYSLVNYVVHRNYNFAVARVRLQGTPGPAHAAQGVKVFFRLWGTQTVDTDWNPGTTYLSDDPSGLNPQYPKAPSDNHTIPFFATKNAPDFTNPNNPEYGTNGINNQTITIRQNDKQWAYFGCFLNLYDPNFIVNNQSVQRQFAQGTHHCLVAEIAYADAPIENVPGVTMSPENTDKLAQRNLQVTPSANPGTLATHRIPQTFDVRPSVPTAATQGLLSYPDELMIDWGNTPAGSTASIYWPQVNSADVLALASWMYGTHVLSASDGHTIQCTTTNGVTYVPIPFGTGDSFAGLFSVDLPPTVVKGQEFNIIVRRISTRQITIVTPPPVPHVTQLPTVSESAKLTAVSGVAQNVKTERYVVGSFQVKIPVKTKEVMLPDEETTLAIFKARLAAMSPTDRWYPVLRQYIRLVSARVDGLGGDADDIAPSFDGAPRHPYLHSNKSTELASPTTRGDRQYRISASGCRRDCEGQGCRRVEGYRCTWPPALPSSAAIRGDSDSHERV